MGKRTYGAAYGTEYYGGSGVDTLSLSIFPISLGEFAYNLDYKIREFTLASIPYIRQQSDQSEAPGEQTLNPAGLWRRSATSWHLGAGQTHFDRPNSNEFRFDTSTGMDIWTKWQLGLLEETALKHLSGSTNLRLAVAGTHLYVTDGTALRFCTNIDVAGPTFTPLTGAPPANAATSIASDGFNVFTAHGTNGLWKTTRGTAAWAGAAHITGTVALVGIARSRVLAANANSVYDVTVAAQGGGGVALGGAGAELLFTHPNTDFAWTAFAEGRNHVYMAGYSGDKSLIYKATIKDDGTGLEVPTVAGELPDGEQVVAMQGYLGPFFVIGIGGLPGWRFALVNDDGSLNIGARVPTPNPVLCFEGQQNFIWYGLGGFTATSGGLGRLSTSEFGDPDALVPAYATDLMTALTGNTLSVVTFQGLRVFTQSGHGVFSVHHERRLVSSGTLDTGEIIFGLNEEKIGLYADITHNMAEGGTHSMAVSVDGEPFVSLGVHEEHTEPFILGEARGRAFELQLGLQRDSVDPTIAQKFISWLLRVQVVPDVSEIWSLPLLISDTVHDIDGNPHPMDPFGSLANISSLMRNKSIVSLIVNGQGFPGVVEDYTLVPSKLTNDKQGLRGFNGTCVVQFKNLTGVS